MRAFLAIVPPPEVARGVADAIALGRSADARSRVRWSNPEQVHLTLRFFADVSREELVRLAQAWTDLAAGTEPFPLATGALGAFPNLRRPRVLWIGVDDPTGALARLDRRLLPDAEPLRPHFTLGRVRDAAPLQERLPTLVAPSPVTWTVAELVLFESRLGAHGAQHAAWQRFALSTAPRPE